MKFAINILFLLLFFSCTSPKQASPVAGLNQRPESLIDKILHLTMIETVVSEIKNFEGVSSSKEVKDAKFIHFESFLNLKLI